MAWFSGKVNLGNFPDFAGGVNKLSESVKNIEKNFDSALGREERSDGTSSASEASSLRPSATDGKALFEPIMGFMGQKGEDSTDESLEKPNSSKPSSPLKDKEIVEDDNSAMHVIEQIPMDKEEIQKSGAEGKSEEELTNGEQKANSAAADHGLSPLIPIEEAPVQNLEHVEQKESVKKHAEEKLEEDSHILLELQSIIDDTIDLPKRIDEHKAQEEDQAQDAFPEGLAKSRVTPASDSPTKAENTEDDSQFAILQDNDVDASSEAATDLTTHQNDTTDQSIEIKKPSNDDSNAKEIHSSTGINSYDIADSVAEVEKVKKETKMMETALLGAARPAQAKADEIAKLMNENEQLKAVIDDLKRKTNEAEIETLREEYHQRVAAIEQKVYALTTERDTLRREQNKKSDAALLLKEKDEIISQVMAEGEELSKKQAAQESQMRKLRAQIKELEEEKKVFITKLQVEENKVESLKRDKSETEKLLQETVEKNQAELTTQKEYYTNALALAKEAEALAEARANSEARTELESRLREAEDRETMLVQTLEELRQTLSRKEQQAVFREDMFHREIEDLQKRYQERERLHEKYRAEALESTRPLLRQIEAMQETAARRAEGCAAVERSLKSRLQEAEAATATAKEKERSINERLTQTISRINVLEAQNRGSGRGGYSYRGRSTPSAGRHSSFEAHTSDASLGRGSGWSNFGRQHSGTTSVNGVTEQFGSMSASDYPLGLNSANLSVGNTPPSVELNVPKSENQSTKPVDLPSDMAAGSSSKKKSICSPSYLNCTPSHGFQTPQEVQSGKGAYDAENSDSQNKGTYFDICLEKTGNVVKLKSPLFVTNRARRSETKCLMDGGNIQILRPGMLLLKGYIPLTDQVKLIKICRDLGRGPGGFYQPGYRDGSKLNLRMMCLGKNWDPETSMYGDERSSDQAKPPPIPYELDRLVEGAIRECHAHLQSQSKVKNTSDILPKMTPNICIVNFYAKTGRLGLHQDKDESQESLRKGLPVVSFSVGDSADFLYGDFRDVDKAAKVVLKSGDVLIFGGQSRNIFHGVTSIIPDTAPKALVEETNLRPGRLNLTFREY